MSYPSHRQHRWIRGSPILGSALTGIFFSALVAATICAPVLVGAHEHESKTMHVSDAWTPVMPEGSADVTMVYMVIRNPAVDPDNLIGALSPVARKIELHQAGAAGEDPKSVSALRVDAGQDLVLSPNSAHLFMVGLKKQLLEDEHFRLALEFERSGRVLVDVVVKASHLPEVHKH